MKFEAGEPLAARELPGFQAERAVLASLLKRGSATPIALITD